jgi:hypothetical protein
MTLRVRVIIGSLDAITDADDYRFRMFFHGTAWGGAFLARIMASLPRLLLPLPLGTLSELTNI